LNVRENRTLEKPRKTLEQPWKNLRKTLENLRKKRRKYCGEICGFFVGFWRPPLPIWYRAPHVFVEGWAGVCFLLQALARREACLKFSRSY